MKNFILNNPKLIKVVTHTIVSILGYVLAKNGVDLDLSTLFN